jgi:DNA topoisomerase-2
MVKGNKTNGKKLEIEDIYKKKNLRDQILAEPDMYIGSVQKDNKEMWIFDNENDAIIKSEIDFVPGFYKIFDEILVNARDHCVRDKRCDTIKVIIDKKQGTITCINNGQGIPVQLHKEYNIYVAELLFGNLLTSINYDTKGKTTGGKNGYGSKLAAIFSKKFIIETVNDDDKKIYTQEFTNNLEVIGKPIIEKCNEKPYTKIIFYPDYEKFNLENMTDDMFNLFKKRVYDMTICSPPEKNIKVFFNNERIAVATFQDYIQMHYRDTENIIYDTDSERWKIGFIYSKSGNHEQNSYVNGIWTYYGGTHVDYITDQITKEICDKIQKEYKIKAKPQQIKEFFCIFVNSVIEDPSFNSQTKDTLTKKVSSFGSTYKVNDIFMKKVFKTGIIDDVVKITQFKEQSSLSKTDGKKTSKITGIDKLDDAEWAGTKNSKETRLIITEGDSAKAFAISGIELIGNKKYGVWPYQGKSLNVRNATKDQIKNNKEFNTFKQIMGLKNDVEYIDTSKLRYGGIIILTDQDLDGSHIKGLVINMLQFFWPSLLKIDGFVQTISTPILKAFKRSELNDKNKKHTKVFYTESDFNKWLSDEFEGDTIKLNRNWKIKYYKGLGTSDANEAKEIFSDFENRVISYVWENEKYDNTDTVTKKKKGKKGKLNYIVNDPEITESVSYNKITLAFDEERADDRKAWLGQYDHKNILEYDKQEVTYTEFIDKELIHFSNYDNIRAIPSICDGFKPSQRKIIYGCIKKNIGQNELKVSQLANYVSEHTAYKHGETSLQEAIVGMAQNFTGTNNINLLFPSGNFGYRRNGIHASARYIFTYLETITSKIFRKEDNYILNYIEDEGQIVEPVNYIPIVPMILINGTKGIGTGYSTTIPSYNIIDIIDNIILKMNNKKTKKMHPYFHGFKGKIEQVENETNKYKMYGIYDIIDDETIQVTELPVVGNYVYSDKYKAYLETLEDTEVKKKENHDKIISFAKSDCGNNTIDFKITFKGGELQKLCKQEPEAIEKLLKITANFSTTNFWLHNTKGSITYYDSPNDILDEFYDYRLVMYQKRKDYMIVLLDNQLQILKYRVKFIKNILDKIIIIERKKQSEIIAKLEELKYPKLTTKKQNEENNDDDSSDKSYNYLTKLPLFSLTLEKIDELNDEYDKKKKELEDYKNTTVQEFWRRELDELLVEYNSWIANRDMYSDTGNSKKSKKNSGEKKTKNTKVKK